LLLLSCIAYKYTPEDPLFVLISDKLCVRYPLIREDEEGRLSRGNTEIGGEDVSYDEYPECVDDTGRKLELDLPEAFMTLGRLREGLVLVFFLLDHLRL
jgi:hypothetical protein